MNQEIIKKLWEIGAISINTKEQFTLASGDKSPIYFDCRKLISYPEIMDIIAKKADKIICETIGKKNVDIVAGGATAGIPFAAWISELTHIPLVYIRKEPKGYGKGAQIEGFDIEEKNVVLIEDLITSGYSKVSFIEGIRNAGATVEHCIVVFDREQEGDQHLKQQGVLLHSMANLTDALEYGKKNELLSEEDYEVVRNYLNK